MGTVRCLEDFKIWQDARLLVNQVYLYTAGLKDYGFNDQVRRAAVSVMNNIAEGYEAGGNVMFKKDLKYIFEIKVNGLLSDCMVLSKGISKLITYLIPQPATCNL